MFTTDDKNLDDFTTCDPYMAQELTMKRSTSFKDPLLTGQLEGSTWNQFNHCPTKQLDKLIRPSIVEMDARGCERIIQKINDDRNMKEAMKEYMHRNRQQIREKFLQRTQQLERLQHKSGQKLFKDTAPNETQNNFTAGLSQLRLFKNSQIKMLAPPPIAGKPDSAGMGGDQYMRTINSFFGSTSQLTSNPDRLARLAQPKQDYDTNNIFNHQDFRGMLHADHEEALKNSTAATRMRKSQSQRFMTAPASSKLSLATSHHQTELK